MNIGMISCAQRAETVRRETLRQFPWRVHVSESACEPACGAENMRTAYHAIYPFLGTTGALFIEDDIDIDPHLLEWFYIEATRKQAITVMCLLRTSLMRPDDQRDIRRPPVQRRIVPLQKAQMQRRGPLRFYGTQCVFLPKRVIQAVADSWTDFVSEYGGKKPCNCAEGDFCRTDGFDFWLGRHYPDQLYVALPNPAQHRNPPKMRHLTRGQPPRSRPDAYSDSFGLPWRD